VSRRILLFDTDELRLVLSKRRCRMLLFDANELRLVLSNRRLRR
jgi:hypothetical protein